VESPRQLVFRAKPRDLRCDGCVRPLDSGRIGHIVESFTGADQLGPAKRTMAGKRATADRSGRTISTGRSGPPTSSGSVEHLCVTVNAEPGNAAVAFAARSMPGLSRRGGNGRRVACFGG